MGCFHLLAFMHHAARTYVYRFCVDMFSFLVSINLGVGIIWTYDNYN